MIDYLPTERANVARPRPLSSHLTAPEACKCLQHLSYRPWPVPALNGAATQVLRSTQPTDCPLITSLLSYDTKTMQTLRQFGRGAKTISRVELKDSGWKPRVSPPIYRYFHHGYDRLR